MLYLLRFYSNSYNNYIEIYKKFYIMSNMTATPSILTVSLRDSLRIVCRSLIKPVYVLTAKCNQPTPFTSKGELRGCTVSSLRILEGNQAMFSMNSDRIFTSILGSDVGINLLHHSQQDLCYRFSQTKCTAEEQFRGIDVKYVEGVPLLEQFHTAATGRIVRKLKTGTSILYMVELTEILKGMEGDIMFLADGSTSMRVSEII
jgi:flavin reductase (DIM6/NTAB) family NADH-FMN oxidoreductase RutF